MAGIFPLALQYVERRGPQKHQGILYRRVAEEAIQMFDGQMFISPDNLPSIYVLHTYPQ